MNELPFSLKREPEQWADLYQLIKIAAITAESEEIMNSKFKQTVKRLISGLVAAATAITMLPHIPAFAETGTTTYSYDGYDVEYSVLNEWDNGQTVEIKVTNTSDDSILNWAVKYNAQGEISNLWNAAVYDNQGEDYIIKNSGWNYEIAPGQTVNFGYTLVDDKFETPDDFELCSKRVDVAIGYEAALNIIEQWNTGIKGEIVITNTSDEPLEAWTYSFDSNFTIDNLWDARILASADNHYTIASEMWTNPIAVGDSKVIGFTAFINEDITPEISNGMLTVIEIDILEIDWEDTTDTDGDGLPDVYEKFLLGTDEKNPDTDGDGLTDYQETFITETDPLKYDSVTEEISDSDVDIDGDGLSNIQEIELGTDPRKSDTDNDGLSDSDELNIYNTDPLNPDTDEDGLNDGDEVILGLNPLKSDTDDNGVLDSDEYIEQDVNRNRFDNSLFSNNVAIPSALNVSAKGNANNNINISEYTGYLKGEERAYVGKVIEITNSDINNGILTFALDNKYNVKKYEIGGTITNGLLICYNDGEYTTPLETVYDEETRTLSADISSEGIYFVLDVMGWLDLMGVDLSEEENFSITPAARRKSANNVSKSDISIADSKIKAQVDIVFVIDTTGSMGSYITNVKNNITAFVNEIEAAGISPSFALVDYRDITCDGQYSTNIKKNNDGDNWFKNAEDFKSAIAKLTVNGGGDGPETAIDGLEMARRLNLRTSSQKFFVLVTDANYKIANNYGIESMSEMIELLVNDKINVSVISNTSYNSTYRELYENTGGLFANVGSNFKDELLKIADMINEETNNGYWIALKGLVPQIVKLDEKPSIGSAANTDEDTRLDIEELKSVEPMDTIDVSWFLYLLGLPRDYTEETIPYYDYYSNPTLEDTDFDGIDDGFDPFPTNNTFSGIMHYNHNDDNKTCDVEFNVDYRTLFGNNTEYSQSLANLSILYASDAYDDNYIEVTEGTSGGADDGCVTFGGLFGLDGKFITIDGDDYLEDKDDITQFYVGHRTVKYGGEEREIIILSVRGTNSTNAEWSSNFDVGADTSEYYNLTGSHPDWKNKENHKGFDVTMNRVLKEYNKYAESQGFNSDSIKKTILVTGHSRGGAIANLLGAYFEKRSDYKSFTYTFASPFTTTDPLAESYSTIMNVMNTDDLIPHLPIKEWDFKKYGKMFKISVEDNYEYKGLFIGNAGDGTFEKLVGFDYNNDGGTQRTLSYFSKIATGRDDLYVYDESDDGKVNLKNKYHTTKSGAEEEMEELKEELAKYKLDKFCTLYVVGGGFLTPYHVEVNYCPAYLMQDLANLTTSKQLENYPTFGFDTRGKYAYAKTSFIVSSGFGADFVVGGMVDPHMQPTYYLIAHNTLESQYDSE